MKTKKDIIAFIAVLMLSIPMAFATEIVDISDITDLDGPPDLYHPILQIPNPDVDSPNWSSGALSVHQSTHQFIVDKAIAILNKDFSGLPLNNYTATLRAGADWPDQEERDGITFKGHFYDPDTGANWLNETSPTAQTRLIYWYNQAVSKYKAGETTTGMSYLGRALHYAADLSTPHHAANKTAVNSYHKEYEQWAQEHQTSYVATSASSSTYTWAKNTSVGDMGHNFAVNAKSLINDANSMSESRYATATATALPKAQRNCVGIMYKFCVTVGLIK